jgi:hypothetical protein
MAKRSTIGENPLDAVIQAHPLDTVVPDLSVVGQAGRGAAAEVQGRLQDMAAELKALRAEVAGVRTALGEAAAVKGAVTGLQNELAGLRRDIEPLKAEAAAGKVLQAEVMQLKGELAQIRASAGPGDLPWWMRGKKQ